MLMMHTQISKGILALIFSTLLPRSTAYISGQDAQFNPTAVEKAASAAPTDTQATAVATTSLAPAATDGTGAQTSTGLTSAAVASFFPCKHYHVPEAPGQSGPGNVCLCEGSTYALSLTTSGTSSDWCGYTEKPTSTLGISAPTTTLTISPAATPLGDGKLDVFSLRWCSNAPATCDNAIAFLGMVYDSEFNCGWLDAANVTELFSMDQNNTATNEVPQDWSPPDLGFRIINGRQYGGLADVLFTKQIDGFVQDLAQRCHASNSSTDLDIGLSKPLT